METHGYKFPTKLHEFNWVQIPGVMGRVSRKLLTSFTDGYFLAATRAGAILSILLFVLGFAWGWKHFDFQYIYTESIWFLIIAIIIGSLSSHLGLLFTIGFAIGDFFFSGVHFNESDGIKSNLALLISYIVLMMITTVQAVTVKSLAAEIRLPHSFSRPAKLVIAILIYAALTYFYIFFWASMTPVLIRPVFTWAGSSTPTVAAMVILQTKTSWLIWPGVVMSIARIVAQGVMASKTEYQVFFQAMEKKYFEISARPTLTAGINPWIKITLYTAISVLTLSGMFLGWKPWIIVGAFAFFFQAITQGLIRRPSWLEQWSVQIYKIPSIFRLAVAFLIIYGLSRYFIKKMWESTSKETFLPLIIVMCFSFLILFFLNPGQSQKKVTNEKQNI